MTHSVAHLARRISAALDAPGAGEFGDELEAEAAGAFRVFSGRSASDGAVGAVVVKLEVKCRRAP